MESCIAILDCNNFYVSCERAYNPELEGKPLIVLSSNDGCVISRSEEAKALGIAMGVPVFKIREQIERQHIQFRSANFRLYEDVSSKIMGLLLAEAPEVEIYSIDEAFLDMTGMQKYCDGHAFITALRERILRELHIPVSIGVAPTKALAKIANKLAKRRKTTYIEWLMTPELQEEALKAMAVEDVWGVGRRNAIKLHLAGIHTAWDLSLMREAEAQLRLSVTGVRLVHELKGYSRLALAPEFEPKKHIGTSRSFGTPVETLAGLKEAVASFVGTAARKLRQQQSAAGTLAVYVLTNRFGKDYYHNMAQVRLPAATAHTPELLQYAWQVLAEVYRPGLKYKKAGVLLSGIVPQASVQRNLFDIAPREKYVRLTYAIDHINRKLGKHSLEWSACVGASSSWRPLSQFASEYTHEVEEMPIKLKPWW